jgi:hypothetical protein
MPTPSSPAVMPEGTRIQYEEDFFVYTAQFAALAPAAVAQSSIQIQADSHFKWIKATLQCDIAAAAYLDSTRPIPLASLQITDGGTGRQLLFQAMPLETIFGSGALPFILPVPRIFRARSNISLSITNFSAATTYNIRLAFVGTKMFAKGGNPL